MLRYITCTCFWWSVIEVLAFDSHVDVVALNMTVASAVDFVLAVNHNAMQGFQQFAPQ